MHEVKIPDIAENVESGTIGSILVAKGDQVEEEQSLVEIETDKASTDIPSPAAGTIAEIKVKEGDEVKVGEVIILIETKGADSGKEEKEPEKEEKQEEEKAPEQQEPEEKTEPEPQKETPEKPEPAEQESKQPEEASSQPKAQTGAPEGNAVPAPPSVRRFAREIGADISQVKGTGPGNRITVEDVKTYAKSILKRGGAPGGGAISSIQLPDFSQWGETEREPMSRIREITADTMTASWQNIPHVTQFDEANVSELEKFMQKSGKQIEKAGGKLTVTAVLLKISALALEKFPRFNASLDLNSKEIIYKKYVHVGIAVDTPQGLLVPVIRDVNTKSITDLSLELSEIAQKTRDRKISPDALQGGNFTISNLGGIGGTGFTPVVLPPQVAILGVSRSQTKPVWNGSEFEPASVLPLSLSYDHRIIDGADGARFLRWICAALENPMSVFL